MARQPCKRNGKECNSALDSAAAAHFVAGPRAFSGKIDGSAYQMCAPARLELSVI
jgi:hypothetical protein